MRKHQVLNIFVLVWLMHHVNQIMVASEPLYCDTIPSLKIKPFTEDNLIRLNISWDESLDAYITIYSMQNDCFYNTNDKINENETFLIKPHMDIKSLNDPINHNCNYTINITNSNFDSCEFNYTLPECVNTICNCAIHGPQIDIDSIVYTSPGKYHLECRNLTGSKPTQLLTLMLVYEKTGTIDSPSNQIETDFNSQQCIADFNLTELVSGTNYTFTAFFYSDETNCEQKVDYYFVQRSNNPWVVFTLLTFTCVLIIALSHDKIKMLSLKIVRAVKRRLSRTPATPSSGFAFLSHAPIPMQFNPQYIPAKILTGDCDDYEFPRQNIILKEMIGSGAFGKVYSARIVGSNQLVAVKMLCENPNQEAIDDLSAEIEIFKKIKQHPNIVTLLGCCTIETPYFMIMEYVPCGDLKNYLHKLRNTWKERKRDSVFFSDSSDGAYIAGPAPQTPTSVTSSRLPSTSDTISTNLDDGLTPLFEYTPTLPAELNAAELQNFALQIASGMAHLESIPITHRDLAARNILISEFKVLKISDFGLSRTGPYINRKSKRLPLRWMAPEAVTEQKYDSRTDVWSFGVVLWEIGTLGAFPYDRVPDSYLVQHLRLGNRLERPEVCTNELYAIMRTCWAADPADRPSFAELVEILDVRKRRVYDDFSQLNPTYVFPPIEVQQGVAIVRIT